MFALVIGPNNSGKSSYAEKLIKSFEGKERFYIATMIPYGEEGLARVKKHLLMRAELDMITIEDPYLEKVELVREGSDVLLEDLSNLVANRIFEKHDFSCDKLIDELMLLKAKVRNLIVVSIGGLIEEGYDAETTSYINSLNEINDRLMQLADNTIMR